MRRLFVLLVITVLAGCFSEPEWRTKDISGLMPALGFTLTSERGETVTAKDYLGKVGLLFFGYTSCPDICPATLGRLRAALDQLDSNEREQVLVLFVSVDPERDDPRRLREYTDAFGRDFVGLTGTSEQLEALTKRYRTTYGLGEPDKQGNYLVSHSSAVFAFDRQGEVQLLMRDADGTEAIAADIAQLVKLD